MLKPLKFLRREKRMRKLDLKNYTISVRTPQGVIKFVTFQFRESIAGILTHPSLGLNGPELLEADMLAEKVEKSELEILLTDTEYLRLVDSCKRFRGFNRNDAQLIKRIYNCPEVPDENVKKGGKTDV